MAKDRIVLPGLPRSDARVIIEEFTRLKDELAALKRKPGRAGIVTSDYSAKAGEFVNIEARSGTLVTITLPESTPALRGARITLAFRNANQVRIVAVQGTVNGESFVLNDRPGTYDAVADGLGGWAVQVGVSEEGSGAGGSPDAEYVVGAADASLPNARVATDSTEIDAVLTTPNVISWALNVASVALSKLANLTGLSVLGRATNSSGVMAAITATEARQVLRANNAATGLEWDYPVSVGTWEFDGTSYIDGPDALHFERTQPFSLHAKIIVSGSSAQYVLSNQATDGTLRGYAVWLKFTAPSGIVFELVSSGSNRIRVYVSGSLTDLNDGLEHSIIFTYDGTSGTGTSSVDIYIDGTLETTTSLSGETLSATTVPSAADFIVGASPTGGSIWSGSIRDVAVWDVQLSGAQVAEVYNGGADVDLTTLTSAGDLQLWWGIVPSGSIDLSGNGLDGTPNGTLGDQQVHSLAEGGGIDISAADGTATLTREALTGFAAASAGSNATTSAEPIVTYSASSNMSAERVLTSSTSNTVSTSVANQIQVQRAALTGDVTASANSNATTIANDVVTNAKAANMAANTIKANATGSTADPGDLAISADSLPARVGSNLVSHPWSTVAGAGLAYSAGALSVNGSTSIVIASDQPQRAALTGDVTASQDSNVTAIAAGVIVDADVNASAAIALSKLATQGDATWVGRPVGAGTGVPTANDAASASLLVRSGAWDRYEETGAGPHADYAVAKFPAHIKGTHATGQFNGVSITNAQTGDMLVFSHQGSGYTELLHNTTSSTANRLFNGRLGKNIRIFDNEVAIYLWIDTSTAGGNFNRWELVYPQPPFAHADDNAADDIVVHNGTHWVVDNIVDALGGVQSITGATTQDQVDSLVAAGEALGLWTDDR